VSQVCRTILQCSIYVYMCAWVVTQHRTFTSVNEYNTINVMVIGKCYRSIEKSDTPHLESIFTRSDYMHVRASNGNRLYADNVRIVRGRGALAAVTQDSPLGGALLH